MKRFVRCLLLFALGAAQHALAGGIVHIANGDCAGLKAAVAAAQLNGPAEEIVLANRGSYGYCPIAATGNLTVNGAGATLQVSLAPDVAAILVAAGAKATIRNLNLVSTPTPIPPVIGPNGCGLGIGLAGCPQFEFPVILNMGDLLLDSVSESGVDFAYGVMINNQGSLTLRNATVVNNASTSGYGGALFTAGAQGTTIDISHSTIANNTSLGHSIFDAPWYNVGFSGTIRVANSVVAANSGEICSLQLSTPGTEFISLGGNVFTDDSCSTHDSKSRVVPDARLLDFGTHGGVVGTLALNYDSPAIGNGLLANCEATDARGFARGQDRCDSGAYEIGGGNGKLSATGMSGLYFNAANNGHYVSIQRLYGNDALVIWNTFDQSGTPAWLYGVGTVSDNKIHVDQVAQNVGGTLHAGGGVTGATPTLWGTLDVNLSDCYTASLSYSSPLPQFGSGSTTLQRLAFLDGVNCAR